MLGIALGDILKTVVMCEGPKTVQLIHYPGWSPTANLSV